jgi:hypothetical protein
VFNGPMASIIGCEFVPSGLLLKEM